MFLGASGFLCVVYILLKVEKEKFKDTSEVLKQSLSEVRQLSKTLKNEVVLNIGFEQSITNELNRLKK